MPLTQRLEHTTFHLDQWLRMYRAVQARLRLQLATERRSQYSIRRYLILRHEGRRPNTPPHTP